MVAAWTGELMQVTAIRTCLILLLAAIGTGCGSDDDPAGPMAVDGDAGDVACPSNTPPFDFGPTGLSATNEAVGVKVYLETASDKPPFYGPND